METKGLHQFYGFGFASDYAALFKVALLRVQCETNLSFLDDYALLRFQCTTGPRSDNLTLMIQSQNVRKYSVKHGDFILNFLFVFQVFTMLGLAISISVILAVNSLPDKGKNITKINYYSVIF